MPNENSAQQSSGPTGMHPKRFYKQVEVREESSGYGIALDGRVVKTPLKRTLAVPTSALAEAVAAEWLEQGERIIAATMPLTRLANSSVDHGEKTAPAIIDEYIAYAGADLLCYRADMPEELVARQADAWDPLLTWAAQNIGARLIVTTGIVHQTQPEPVFAALRTHVAGFDHFRLTALQAATALTGSAVIALALAERHVSGDQAWAAATIDEDWQAELWGKDDEAEHMRTGRRAELEAYDRFLGLILNQDDRRAG